MLFLSVRLHLVVDGLQKRITAQQTRGEAVLRDLEEKRHAVALRTEYLRIEPQARALGLRPPHHEQVRHATWGGEQR